MTEPPASLDLAALAALAAKAKNGTLRPESIWHIGDSPSHDPWTFPGLQWRYGTPEAAWNALVVELIKLAKRRGKNG